MPLNTGCISGGIVDYSYKRSIVATLANRLNERRRFMQVLVGPRQTGKTTALQQCIDMLPDVSTMLVRASIGPKSTWAWLQREWDAARFLARKEGEAVLFIDEIQYVSQWSAIVKDLWDEDTDANLDLKVVLTGSSSLLLQKGLREALTGRFEIIRCQQWDYSECRDAFGFSLDDYLFFGGYPGAAPYRSDKRRWIDYMDDSIIRPSISRDVVALESVRKPALMEALFYTGAPYSAQEISYRKLMGQFDDAGNTTTIAHYLDLLKDAGLMAGLRKYDTKPLKTRSSSPRLAVFDTGLMTATYGQYRDFLLTDPDRKGHLVESAVGAYLMRRGCREHFDVFWWRDGKDEVDFVLQSGQTLCAVEVKSGRIKSPTGLDEFHKRFKPAKSIVIGSSACTLEDFLLGNVEIF